MDITNALCYCLLLLLLLLRSEYPVELLDQVVDPEVRRWVSS